MRLLAGCVLLVACALGAVSAQAPRQVSLLVTHGAVVTVDRDRRVIEDGAVAIDGARIADVGPTSAMAAKYRGAETIDAGGAVVMPGLINTHTHAPMVLAPWARGCAC